MPLSASARLKAGLESPAVTLAATLVALVALILSIGVGIKQYQLSNCLAKYNDAASRATQARLLAADEDRAAQDDMFRAVAADPRSAIRAIKAYNEARASADKQRSEHPYPAPPSETC